MSQPNPPSRLRGFAPTAARHAAAGLLLAGAALGPAVLLPAAARAQQFTNLWAFGDSFADQGNAENIISGTSAPYPSHVPGPILYHTYPIDLQSIYGIPSAQYFNYAIDGATSTTQHVKFPELFGFLTEIQIFNASRQQIPPNNLVTISIGLNDPFRYGNLSTAQVAAQAAADMHQGAQSLIAAGGRTFAIAGFSSFIGEPTGYPSYLSEYSAAYYNDLQPTLASLSRPGVRFFLFDEARMFNQVAANPAAYGFLSATTYCDTVPGCARLANSPLQFDYLSYDGEHFTTGGFQLEARYMANQLGAPNTVPAETALAQVGATSFADAVFRRLDAYRWQNVAPAAPGAMPLSVYLQGLGTFGSRSSRFGADGFDYSDGGVIFGGEYSLNPALLVGLAFNYSHPNASLQGAAGNLGVSQYQFAGYASYSGANLFTDALLAGGHNSFDVRRPGIIDTITASPSGTSFVAALNSGYLPNLGALRIGPIWGLTYADSHVNGYTESGDPLLTQSVGGQHENSLTGDAGVQARFPIGLPSGMSVSSYVDLVAERDFLGNSRVLTTAFTAAPALPIYSLVGGSGTGTYGRVTGGVAGMIAPRLSAGVQAELTFARPGGNDYGVTANLAYHF